MEMVKLNNKTEVPVLGLGLRGMKDPDICEQVILAAFEAGYRRLDTSMYFNNDVYIGNALGSSGLKRDSIYISTKLTPFSYRHDAKKKIETTIRKMKCGYVDSLLLGHFAGDIESGWKALEWACEQGLAKSIGVSNFYLIKHMEEIARFGNIKPQTDQIECHPYMQHPKLSGYLAEEDIRLEAWFPLAGAHPALMENPLLMELSRSYHRSTAQIILRWHIQSGHIIFPGTMNPGHMKSNLHCLDFELSQEDMAKIKDLDTSRSLSRYSAPLKKFCHRHFV
ncbi:MAG: aldo/keto reductase [Lachnospiraceae bacterium]|nr:aldo/keto reductase [Lachnospiraceae bacterium]